MSSAAACNTTHNEPILSFFTTTISVILFIATFSLNVLIILTFRRNKRLLHRSVFYKMLLNITIADLMTAVISDVVSISFHTKEGIGKPIPVYEVRLLHCGLFMINGASILTMSLLCLDRVVALLWPHKYRNGIKDSKCFVMLASTWVISLLLSIPYFYMGYIKYLAVFSATTVTLTLICLLATSIIYKKYFAPFQHTVKSPSSPKNKNDTQSKVTYKTVNVNGTQDVVVTPSPAQSKKNLSIKDDEKQTKKEKKPRKSEQKVHKSFMMMLLVFLFTYLPSVVMVIYMNTCNECNCMLIHCLRDLTYISILSSAFWRPLNFVLRLKTLRKGIRRILNIEDNRAGTVSESMTNSASPKSRHSVEPKRYRFASAATLDQSESK